MARVLLILPSATYRASAFLDAARRLDTEVVVACDREQVFAATAGDRFVRLDLSDVEGASERIVALAGRQPLDAVLAVDDQGVLVAARAAERLGLDHNPPAAVAATRDKAVLRRRLARSGIVQPQFAVVDAAVGPERSAEHAAGIGFPVVVKPATLAASRGVIRADDPAAARSAIMRVRAILDGPTGDRGAPILIERYVPGEEVAVEGLLHEGRLQLLAIFDKPDPLVGPYFEETIYVTPSRHPGAVQRSLAKVVAEACTALGLRTGPVHAEVRLARGAGRTGVQPVLLEVAARTIGGRCSQALSFTAGRSLEEIVLAHAIGKESHFRPGIGASGVMMLPIPASGRLRRVRGLDAARACPHVIGVEITAPVGRWIEALPEGDRYLGFCFARATTPDDVEAALRAAHAELRVEFEPLEAPRAVGA